MKVGYSIRDITPPVGVRLGGYAHRLGKPSQIVHDPLYTSAIFLSSNKEDILLIHADILGIYRNLADEIKKLIHKETGIKIDNIFFTTTHTHSGPETVIPMWPNTFPYSLEEKELLNSWLSKFKEKVVEASIEAYNNSSFSFINVGTAYCQNVSFNRTFRNNVIDPQIPFILFKNSNNKILLTNYSCHPVCNVDFGISADYPGVLYDNLKRNGFENFFTLGAAGDIDPIEKGRAFILNMSSSLSSAIISSLNSSSSISEEEINVRSKTITLKVRNISSLEEAKSNFIKTYDQCKNKLEDVQCMSRLLYADEEYEVARDFKNSIETIVKTFTIGKKVAFISIPGELFVEIGLKIKDFARTLGYTCSIISTCSEDYIGYIPNKSAFEKKSYEATLARWSRVTQEAEDVILKEVTDCLKSSPS